MFVIIFSHIENDVIVYMQTSNQLMSETEMIHLTMLKHGGISIMLRKLLILEKMDVPNYRGGTPVRHCEDNNPTQFS